MANSTFSGPVRSEGGFQTISKNPDTGAITVTLTLADGVFIIPGLPTADPLVEGQVWSNAGVLTVSAG